MAPAWFGAARRRAASHHEGVLSPGAEETQEGDNMAKRQRLSGSGILEHPQPFPSRGQIGNMVFTSNVFSDDRTLRGAEGIDTQCKRVRCHAPPHGKGGQLGLDIPSHGDNDKS
jgi:hypothetical protein